MYFNLLLVSLFLLKPLWEILGIMDYYTPYAQHQGIKKPKGGSKCLGHNISNHPAVLIIRPIIIFHQSAYKSYHYYLNDEGRLENKIKV